MSVCDSDGKRVSVNSVEVSEREKDEFQQLHQQEHGGNSSESSYDSYSSSTSSSYEDSSSHRDGENEVTEQNNQENGETINNNQLVCLYCAKKYVYEVEGHPNPTVCVEFTQSHCTPCRERITKFWDDFLFRRSQVHLNDLQNFDDIFFRYECVHHNNLSLSSILCVYEKAMNHHVNNGDHRGTRLYEFATRQRPVDVNWYINYCNSHEVWKNASNKAFLEGIALFFVFPHVYMCWPEKAPLLNYIRGYRREADQHVIYKFERKPPRTQYTDAFYFLRNFFIQYPFNVISSCQQMDVAPHAQNTGWGKTKFPYFYFKGEPQYSPPKR